MATNITCPYCRVAIPQPGYNAHIREKHAIPSAEDLRNYASLYAAHYPRRPAAAPARASTAPNPSSSARAATSSDATLQGTATNASKLTTTFSAWQAKNQFFVPQYVTADDVSTFRVDRSDQPRTAARSLQKETKYDVQTFVAEFPELPIQERERCHALIRRIPVFACLSAYIFTHLTLCVGDEPRLLESFLARTEEWIDKEEGWCLVNYKTIKADLVGFLEQSQVAHHHCNQQLLDSTKLHYLDIHGLAALLIIYSTDQNHVQSFYAMKDTQAQAILDLLQELIDLKSQHLDDWYKRRFLDAVVRLSRKSRQYPRSLNIAGVDDITSTGDRGGFGAIFRGKLSGRAVALKELQTAGRSTDDYLKDFCQEAVVWRNVHHRNCLPFYGVTNVDDRGVQRMCLVSPWMTNGNLSVYLTQNPDVPRLPLLLDIASGLEYLHAMQPTIAHGDLKGLNIFITASGRACLADFGLATVHDALVSVPTTAIQGVYGTAGYMAPELISAWSDPDGAALVARLDRRRCDIFAFGCIMYEVYTGGPPFRGNAPTVRSGLLLSGERPPRPTDARAAALGLDDDIWLLTERLWAHRPEARLVAESARDFLRYKMSVSSVGGESRERGDPEWDVGFLSALGMNNDLFAL